MSILTTGLLGNQSSSPPAPWNPESIEVSALEITEGTFNNIVVQYTDGDEESIEVSALEITEGAFNKVVIEYEDGDEESIEVSALEITEGTHVTP